MWPAIGEELGHQGSLAQAHLPESAAC
jgi:hypothetical protein